MPSEKIRKKNAELLAEMEAREVLSRNRHGLPQEVSEEDRERHPAFGAFRDGLPSNEDIRSHEARGGTWATKANRRIQVYRFRVCPDTGEAQRFYELGQYWTRMWKTKRMRYVVRCRPIDNDAFPAPWPDEEASEDSTD